MLAIALLLAIPTSPALWLGFADPSPSTPGSTFGHVFLVAADDEPNAFSTSYSFGADTSSTTPAESVVLGLAGALQARWETQPFGETLSAYHHELRSVFLWRLRLDDTDRVLARLAESLGIRRSYSFAKWNCARATLAVLGLEPRGEITTPQEVLWKLGSRLGARISFPSPVVVGRDGLDVSELNGRALAKITTQTLEASLAKLRVEFPQLSYADGPDERRARFVRQRVLDELRIRAEHGDVAIAGPDAGRPERAHGKSVVSVGVNSHPGLLLSGAVVSHTELDSSDGYGPQLIRFLAGGVEVGPRGKIALLELTLLQLETRSAFSWGIEVGTRRLGTRSNTGLGLEVGGSVRVGALDLSLLGGIRGEMNEDFSGEVVPRARLSLGLELPQTKTVLETAWRAGSVALRCDTQIRMSVDRGLGLGFDWQPSTGASGSLRFLQTFF